MTAALFVLAACLFSSVHCGKTEEAVPELLLGVWMTEDGRYQDRYIEFNSEMIIFGTGSNSPNIYLVDGIEQKRSGAEEEYAFRCRNAEGTGFRLVFHVEESPDGFMMRLNNPREVVWDRISDPKEAVISPERSA